MDRPSENSEASEKTAWPAGGGETGALIRRFDWSATAVGPIECWPQSLRTIVDLMLASPQMMSLVWGPECVHIYNDAFAKLIGSRHPGAMSWRPAEAFAERNEAFEQLVREALSGRAVTVRDQPYRFARTNVPEDVRLDISLSPVRDEHGVVSGVLGIFNRTAPRVLADRQLRASERGFRLLVENVKEYAIFQTDPEGTVTTWNAGAERLFGYSNAEMLGHNASWLFTPEDRESGALGLELRHVMAGERQEQARWLVRKDGSRFWAQWITEPVYDEAGRIHGAAKVLRDETERMQAEAALRLREHQLNAVANLVPDLLWRAEPDGNTTWYNQRWYAYTGQTKAEAEGFGWTDAVHPDDRERSKARYLYAVRTGQALRQEHRIRGADGSYRWFLFQAWPLQDETGRIRAWFGAATDVHEERTKTEALRFSLAEKEELLKEVHHRVKNNLQIVTSLINLQARQIEDKDALALFDVARNRIQSIATIHELLYRTGSPAAIDLSDYTGTLAHNIVRLYGAQDRIEIEVCGQSASLELERAVPFGLLLNELISNTCKHAFPGGSTGRLTIRTERVGDELEVIVGDTGVGYPPEFRREEPSSLGVFLVDSLARQLHAVVEFNTGPGAEAIVRMPLAPVRDAEDE